MFNEKLYEALLKCGCDNQLARAAAENQLPEGDLTYEMIRSNQHLLDKLESFEVKVIAHLSQQDARLSRLEDDVSGLKSDVGCLKSDVGCLKSDVDYLKSAMERVLTLLEARQ